jgi:hypothetical protein
MQQSDSFDFTIIPNPSSGNISIKFTKNIKGKITVINELGQSIYSKNVLNEDEIDFFIHNSGTYYVKFTDEQGVIITKRVIVTE